MDKLNLKNTEWTGVVTSFYSQYCYEHGVGELTGDEKREKVVHFFRSYFSENDMNPHNLMTMERISFQGILNVAVRNRVIDACVQRLIREIPERMVVNIGCGFDTRFFRLEDFQGSYLDVDFENVIRIKKAILSETVHYDMQSCNNAFAKGIVKNELNLGKDNPIIICEGVFCYIPYPRIVAFVEELFRSHPKATLICDVYLYQPHLVFADQKSKLLLKYPEDGEKRYKAHEKWYQFLDQLRMKRTKKEIPMILKNQTALLEVWQPEEENKVCFGGQEYTPQCWIGIYEKKG